MGTFTTTLQKNTRYVGLLAGKVSSGADLKLNRHFAQAILDNRPAPIDVYRAIEYTLPGILANRSAELGGVPIPIPDFRCEPFQNTAFWETVGLPDSDPPGTPFVPPSTE